MTNSFASTELEGLPYTHRRWMAVDQGWQAVYPGDTQTWYDAEMRELLPSKTYGKAGGSESFYNVVVNFNGYPESENQKYPFLDKFIVEHTDPRYKWTYTTAGAWQREETSTPNCKFASLAAVSTLSAEEQKMARTKPTHTLRTSDNHVHAPAIVMSHSDVPANNSVDNNSANALFSSSSRSSNSSDSDSNVTGGSKSNSGGGGGGGGGGVSAFDLLSLAAKRKVLLAKARKGISGQKLPRPTAAMTTKTPKTQLKTTINAKVRAEAGAEASKSTEKRLNTEGKQKKASFLSTSTGSVGMSHTDKASVSTHRSPSKAPLRPCGTCGAMMPNAARCCKACGFEKGRSGAEGGGGGPGGKGGKGGKGGVGGSGGGFPPKAVDRNPGNGNSSSRPAAASIKLSSAAAAFADVDGGGNAAEDTDDESDDINDSDSDDDDDEDDDDDDDEDDTAVHNGGILYTDAERIEPYRLANLSPVGRALLDQRREQIKCKKRKAPTLSGQPSIRTGGSNPMPPTMSLPY